MIINQQIQDDGEYDHPLAHDDETETSHHKQILVADALDQDDEAHQISK